MKLTTEEKVRLIMKRKGIQINDFVKEYGCTRQNFHQKMKKGTWTLAELDRLCAVIGCEWEITFTDIETGDKL
jgi:DNA-binding Xre family transcriptional regulator